MLRKLRIAWDLDSSRRRQSLRFMLLRLKLALLYRSRLRACGASNIVEKPIFWTPEHISLGSGCHVWHGCRMEGISRHGQAARYSPHIILGDRVGIQQHCHITAASTLVIGNDVNILFGAMITDIDHGYSLPGVNVASQPLSVKETRIGDNCFIGSGAKIMAGTILGANCIVGANAVVRGQFQDGSMIVGIPGRTIKRYDNSTGKWCRPNDLTLTDAAPFSAHPALSTHRP